MPVETGIWKLGAKPTRVDFSPIESERKLEETISLDLTVLSSRLMLIGRQIQTAYGKLIDILAMDSDGNVSVIELKRNRTPRKVVAQLLDYGSWVQGLTYSDIAAIHQEKTGRSLEEGFADRFDESVPEEINQSHELIVVSATLDDSTERIISYLSEQYNVPINAVFFRYFKDGDNEYLTRSWLVEPSEIEANIDRVAGRKGGGKEPWNGRDYYVSFGPPESRDWEDARRYGFISAGGKRWFSDKLFNLQPGHRVFVNLPGQGFVGVGEVLESARPGREFVVDVDGHKTLFYQAPRNAHYHESSKDNPDEQEVFVQIRWLKTVPQEKAFWEKGMFANQASTCKLRNRFTLERLAQFFNVDE